MTYEIIENLVEQLSCDFVLADPEEPETLSGLLPVLKKIHGKCMQKALTDQAKQVLKARKLITAVLKDNPLNVDEKMADLGSLLSELVSSINVLKDFDPESDQAIFQETNQEHDENADPEPDNSESDNSEPQELDFLLDEPDAVPGPSEFSGFDALEEHLRRLADLIRGYCPGDIPDLGAMLNILDEIIQATEERDFDTCSQIAIACKGYVEIMVQEDIHNTKPIEEGVLLLKSILGHKRRNEIFAFDFSDVLELLNFRFEEEQNPIEKPPIEKQKESQPPEELEKISKDDMEILIDFVSEAEENLDTIEVNLIDLEQDPTNKDIINDIFRPFHTIKGVSGFLALIKINILAHTTENLLDSARSGDFLINDMATDVILESVDTLKNLLSRVKKGIDAGFKQPDDDIDVEILRDKLQKLQVALTNGEKAPLGEILVQKGTISSESLDQALEIQKNQPQKKIGEILVEEKKAGPRQVASALMEQTMPKKQVSAQVKVSTDKLDDLVDYAGELVIAQSMLRQKTAKDPSLNQSVAHLGQIVTNMQNIAMSMRMIPIKATFMKMIRLVRDLSRKSGKEVDLKMVGEDTEIDRNVVDSLYEPMVHMIRNSCDHGIESGSERMEQGKSSKGCITLKAYHKGGHIIIEIEDDGKGLDKDRILEKAKSTGLISGNEQMTDGQIYDLILQPGFSTAKKITDVSGRGVGMDVVMNGIEKFRGQLSIDSTKGKGTRFAIGFPLTLAIIDGMLVGVDGQRYVIPTTAIEKAFKPDEKDCFTVEGKGEVVKDRGRLIPVVRLSEIYSSSTHKKNICESLVVVVESKGEKRALLIDELLGKDEYVIKSLGSNLENIEGIAGGAILADGRVGLILDVHGIFSIVAQG